MDRNVNGVNAGSRRFGYINLKDFLANDGNGDQLLLFKTLVGGGSEFYTEITVEY